MGGGWVLGCTWRAGERRLACVWRLGRRPLARPLARPPACLSCLPACLPLLSACLPAWLLGRRRARLTCCLLPAARRTTDLQELLDILRTHAQVRRCCGSNLWRLRAARPQHRGSPAGDRPPAARSAGSPPRAACNRTPRPAGAPASRPAPAPRRHRPAPAPPRASPPAEELLLAAGGGGDVAGGRLRRGGRLPARLPQLLEAGLARLSGREPRR